MPHSAHHRALTPTLPIADVQPLLRAALRQAASEAVDFVIKTRVSATGLIKAPRTEIDC